MYFSPVLIILVAAGLANTQIPNVPSCSLNCFVSALNGDGCSSLTDFACHCQKPQLVGDITPCVKKACAVSDQASVSNVVVSQCSSAGYPISVPHVETNSASGSLSLTTETTAITTGSSKSSANSSSVSATGPRSGSASATATSPALTGSSSASSGPRATSGSTTAGTSTSRTSKPSSSSHSASSSAYTGAAANVKGNIASIAAIVALAANIL